jgi:hypothetical protein
MTGVRCPRCVELEQALSERAAELVEAREQLEALRLALPGREAEVLSNYPAGTTPGQPPLRYVLVDAVHSGVKRTLGGLRRALGGPGAP